MRFPGWRESKPNNHCNPYNIVWCSFHEISRLKGIETAPLEWPFQLQGLNFPWGFPLEGNRNISYQPSPSAWTLPRRCFPFEGNRNFVMFDLGFVRAFISLNFPAWREPKHVVVFVLEVSVIHPFDEVSRLKGTETLHRYGTCNRSVSRFRCTFPLEGNENGSGDPTGHS